MWYWRYFTLKILENYYQITKALNHLSTLFPTGKIPKTLRTIKAILCDLNFYKAIFLQRMKTYSFVFLFHILSTTEFIGYEFFFFFSKKKNHFSSYFTTKMPNYFLWNIQYFTKRLLRKWSRKMSINRNPAKTWTNSQKEKKSVFPGLNEFNYVCSDFRNWKQNYFEIICIVIF